MAASNAVTPEYTDRVCGVLLGGMCGDTLGAPVERRTAQQVSLQYPAGLRDMLPSSQGGSCACCCYTDDTQMAIALAESLVAAGRCDPAAAAAAYARHFQPWRGYSDTTSRVLQAMLDGTPFQQATSMHIGGGRSFGNGAAMRIAPLGLAYHHAPLQVLKQAVCDAAASTGHTHPEGIDGALVQAAAVAWLVTRAAPGAPAAVAGPHAPLPPPAVAGPDALLRHLLADVAETDDMRAKLRLLLQELPRQQALNPGGKLDLASPAWQHELRVGTDPVVVAPSFGGFQIKATDAVAVALWALVCHWRAPEEAVVAAVHHGGDTDTTAGMTGALAGALWVTAWLPRRWPEAVEADGEHDRWGRDGVLALGGQLARLDVRTCPAPA